MSEVASLKRMYPSAVFETSQELGDGGNDSDSGSSIDLNKLTSDEGGSDDAEEVVAKTITTARKKFRLNEKGETPLHV